jgi:hypothetical protein
MRRRHIRLMAKMRLSELIRSEDARTGRKNVTTVAGMVGASALGALILGMAQRAFAGTYVTSHCCPEKTVINGLTLTYDGSHQAWCEKYSTWFSASHHCTYNSGRYILKIGISCYGCTGATLYNNSCASFTCTQI